MRSRYIQSGILKILSDHEFHTLREIAEKIEVHRLTVYRHVQDMSLYYPILSRNGCHGGIKLLKNESAEHNVILTDNEICFIIFMLESSPMDTTTEKLMKKLQGVKTVAD